MSDVQGESYAAEQELAYATRSDLYTDPITDNTDTFTLPNGKVLLLRGLSRMEFLIGQKNWPEDILRQERWNLSKAIVKPSLTESDIEDWQKVSGPMLINEVAKVVNRLSGIASGSDKEAYKSSGE